MLLFLAVVENREEPGDELVERARSSYRSRPDDYDVALRDLIPSTFRKEIRADLETEDYFSGRSPTAVDDWPVFLNLLDRHDQQGGPLLGLTTGLSSLDEAMGGLRGLTFIGGDQGVGKTSLALWMGVAALREDLDLAMLFYSLDMSKTRIFERLLSQVSCVDYRPLVNRTMTEDEADQVAQAREWLAENVIPRLRIVERYSHKQESGLSDELLIQHGQDLLNETEAEKLLVVIDLFQCMDVPPEIGGDREKTDFRLNALKAFRVCSQTDAMPDGFPVLVISRIRKGDGSRKQLRVDDLLGSTRLGYDADHVLLLWPGSAAGKEPTDSITPMILRVDKARDGGLQADLQVDFHHTRSRFTDSRKTNTKRRKKQPSVSGKRKSSARQPSVDPLAGS